MPTSRAIPGFLPSTAGLHFPNRFPPGPTLRVGPLDPRIIGIGDASGGLCGGMCFYTRRRFEAGQPVPDLTDPPENGSELFRQLVREQVRSLRLGVVPARFWRMSAMGADARVARTRNVEWPRIRSRLESGRLTTIGLVRLSGRNPLKLIGNHQVLAYGYETDGDEIAVRIYDPNWPDRDDVTVSVSGGSRQSTGEVLLGVTALD